MRKQVFVIMLAALFGGQARAAGWSPVEMDGHTVREVDMASIVRNGPVATFTARHTFDDLNEYRVERHGTKYLLVHYRVNCDLRTQAQLATEAYDEKMVLTGKHQVQSPQDLPAIKGSIDDLMLDLVCKAGK
ncbi:MAG: surface-adhesin E family protein [Sulfurimicrobium sp.]